MSVEAATKISELNKDWPLGTDKKNEGDNHMRLIKSVLVNAFNDGTDGLLDLIAQRVLLGLVEAGKRGLAVEDDADQVRMRLTTALATGAGNGLVEVLSSAGAVEGRLAIEGGADKQGIALNDATRARLRVSTSIATAAGNGLVEVVGNGGAVEGRLAIEGGADKQGIALNDATRARLRLSTAIATAAGNGLVEAISNAGAVQARVAIEGGADKQGVALLDATRARLRVSTSIATAAGNGLVEAIKDDGTVEKSIAITKDKVTLAGGADAGDVLTTGNLFYKGSDKDNLDFPVGSYVNWTLVQSGDPGFGRNGLITLSPNSGTDYYYVAGGPGPFLTGTWRCRGYRSGATSGGTAHWHGLAQRVQ